MSVFLLAAMAMAGGGFELRLDDTAGTRVVAITVAGSDRSVVAAGRDDLAILAADDAAAALGRLKRNEDFAALLSGADAPPAPVAATGARIIVHKMDYQEDLANHPRGSEQRVGRSEGRQGFPVANVSHSLSCDQSRWTAVNQPWP